MKIIKATQFGVRSEVILPKGDISTKNVGDSISWVEFNKQVALANNLPFNGGKMYTGDWNSEVNLINQN
jgi:hypothetical protein